MRDYGKVHTSFWSSPTIQGLSDDARMLALYLMTSPHTTIVGVFRLPDGYASEDLGWATERVTQGFAELFNKGFANRCETTKWVWITKHLVWNPPENPNQVKAAAKCALAIPIECRWRGSFLQVHGDALGLRDDDETGNGYGTLSEPLLNQKQEQEQKQELEAPTVLVAGTAYRPPSAPSTEIVELYRKHLPQLPNVEVLNASRKRAIGARWREVCCDSKFDRAAGLDWFAWFFEHVGKSRFLTGRLPGKSWAADFDFLMTPTKFARVIEGTYHKDAA